MLLDRDEYMCVEYLNFFCMFLIFFKLQTRNDICFFYFVLTDILWFFAKWWIDHFEDKKIILINKLIYTLKFDTSPFGEISFSPTQRCLLQTDINTSHDSMFWWSKYFKKARTKNVLSSHYTYDMFLHI